MGTGSFPEVKSGRGVTLTPHPLLVPLVTKEQSCTSAPPMGRTARAERERARKENPLQSFINLTYIPIGTQRERITSAVMAHSEVVSRLMRTSLTLTQGEVKLSDVYGQ
jgi:hypothetical protein